MDLIELVLSYGGWAWMVGGLVLLALELVVPGGVLVWMGVAALVTGVVALLQPDSGWPVQILIFGVLAVAAILVWLRYRPHGEATDRPFLNRRAERFIGQEMVLDEPIRDGHGRVVMGDTLWRVVGPDLAAGARVRVVSVEGALLRVEAA
jgi:membrane protein implicated in regulation of membrane protease activity